MRSDEPAELRVRSATASDAALVAEIYNYHVRETVVTFEEEPVPVTEMAGRIAEIQQLGLPWLVAERAGVTLGFAYAARWKTRSAYRHSVETSIYVDRFHEGQGIGLATYRELLGLLGDLDMHAVIGGIALPNEASVRLHEKLGFRKIGHFKEVGFKLGRWVDVGYWELLLGGEGRSPPSPDPGS